ENIEVARAKVEEIEGQIDKMTATLGQPDGSTGKRAELLRLRDNFEKQCWKIKTSHDAFFQVAFKGVRNSMTRFCDRVIEEYRENKAKIYTVEELKIRARTVFAEQIVHLPAVPAINSLNLLN